MSLSEPPSDAVQLVEQFVQRLDSNPSFLIHIIGQLVEYYSSCVWKSTDGGLCKVNVEDEEVEPCESGLGTRYSS